MNPTIVIGRGNRRTVIEAPLTVVVNAAAKKERQEQVKQIATLFFPKTAHVDN